jgi:hypothetical protein
MKRFSGIRAVAAAEAIRYYYVNIDNLSRYLVGYYTTHQPDGVHIEAHCTCGEKLRI